MSQTLIFEDQYKKLGFETFSENNLLNFKDHKYKSEIKIFYIPAGYELSVDFRHYKTENPALFFLTNQHLQIEKGSDESHLIYTTAIFTVFRFMTRKSPATDCFFIMCLKFLLLNLMPKKILQSNIYFKTSETNWNGKILPQKK